MAKFIKNFFSKNYQFIFCFILLFAILIVAINPKPYIASTYKGFSVWATIVLPSLFCFFIFTKLLMQNNKTMQIFSFLNKPFEKIYNCKFGGYIFAMSVLSGYPVGAKLISEFYEQNQIDNKSAKILCAFCSTSGPMFILGSIASNMLNNSSIGLVIFLSHVISSLINGYIFKLFLNKKEIQNTSKITQKMLQETCKNIQKTEQKVFKNVQKPLKNVEKTNNFDIKKTSFNDIMLNTITSVLMVGGSIALCFTLVEILFGVINPLVNITSNSGVFGNISNLGQVIKGVIAGIVEVTNGCLLISSTNLSPIILSTILCALISFGGLSIHLQSFVFLSKCKIKYSFFLLTKVSHMIISILLSLVFGVILL